MIGLADAELAAVTGGESSTTEVRLPFGSGRTTQSDYARCVDTVQRQVTEAHPRPSWPWQHDTNAPARTRAMLEAMPRVCGVPGQR